MSALSSKQDEIRRAIQSSRAPAVVREVVHRRLTYLTWPRLHSLHRACREIAEVPGDVVECGVGLGGSGIVLATLSGRPYRGFDVFGMAPPPGGNDGFDAHARYQQLTGGKGRGPGGDPYFGYRRDLHATVAQTFASFGLRDVELTCGHFEDTLHPDAPIAIAHIDCEWHDPVALALSRLEPQLGAGSIVVVDDYLAFQGVRAATDAFLAAHPGFEVVRRPEHLVLRRCG
jgi:asparagine synthase (glutamine-hydrolysing)